MRQLRALVSKPEEERGNDEVMIRMRDLAKKIENVCTSAVHDGEVPNPVKLIQMHLKYVLFNSEKVKGVYIKYCRVRYAQPHFKT